MENKDAFLGANSQLYNVFLQDVESKIQNDEPIESGDQDVNYGLALQKNRLKQHGIVMKYSFKPIQEKNAGIVKNMNWNDARYTSVMEYGRFDLTKFFYRNQKEIDKQKDCVNFYQIITDVRNHDVAPDDTYICPNCAAPSLIKDLTGGCVYCGSRFQLEDLFPKITNYFFLKAVVKSRKSVKVTMALSVLLGIILGIIAVYFGTTNAGNNDGSAGVIAGILIGGTIFGAIGGYILWALLAILRIIIGAIGSVPKLTDTAGSANKFIKQMQKYTPNFSYQYFTGKVVSLIRWIVFAPNATELPIYAGPDVSELFGNIVESTYEGALGLKECTVKGNICEVVTDVYMRNTYDNGKNLSTKNEVFRVNLRRDIMKPIDMFFSIKKLGCKNCAASYDATKQRTCPYCGTQCDISEDEWVVTSIKRR